MIRGKGELHVRAAAVYADGAETLPHCDVEGTERELGGHLEELQAKRDADDGGAEEHIFERVADRPIGLRDTPPHGTSCEADVLGWRLGIEHAWFLVAIRERGGTELKNCAASGDGAWPHLRFSLRPRIAVCRA